jgi:hypothetical protein
MFLKGDIVVKRTQYSFAMYKVLLDEEADKDNIKAFCLKGHEKHFTCYIKKDGLYHYGITKNKDAIKLLRR